MGIVPVLWAVLAIQASTTLTPEEIMKRAAERSISDTRIMKEEYEFETIKSNNGPPRCKNPLDSRVEIPDLFGPDRYLYTLEDTILLDGRDTFVIRFSPKPNNQPKDPRGANLCQEVRNQALNHLRGTVYVDEEDFGIARVVTHVNNPPATIKKIGRLIQMDVTIEQFRLDNIWATRKISVENEQSFFFGWRAQKESQTISFQNFRLRAP